VTCCPRNIIVIPLVPVTESFTPLATAALAEGAGAAPDAPGPNLKYPRPSAATATTPMTAIMGVDDFFGGF
jgi:hypothetical protein